MIPLKLNPGDAVIMKKKHPCGSSRFIIMRSGSDVRAVCAGCGRDVTVPREKFEKYVKQITEDNNDGKA